MGKSKSSAKRSKYTAKQFLAKPSSNPKGPFQDQSVNPTADKLASKKRAPSSSEDSEADEVEVQSSSEVTVAAPPPCSQPDKKGYTDNSSSSEEDEPVIARTRPRIRIQLEEPTEKPGTSNAQAVAKVHKPPAVRTMKYHEVVIVGVPQTTDEREVQVQTGACKTRRISKRVEGQLTQTSAVVLSYEGEPPTTVFVDHQRFKTRPYVRPATRCFRCQGYNHLQANCTKAFRCARCGKQHQTRDCEVKDRKEFRCVNCKGAHSSASPTCPAFHKVQDSWVIVANKGVSYADAIRSVVRQRDPEEGGRCIAVNNQRRADVIEPTVNKKLHVADVPTQAMKPWIRKPIMKSVEVQTVEEPKEAAVQTCCDVECQTDFPPPAEKSQQTSADIAIQTIEVVEVAAQTSADVETQANIIDAEKHAEDQFFLATLLQIVGAMMRTDEDIDWSELGEKFNFVADKMAERGFPIKLAPRRSTRQQDNYGYRYNPARGSALRRGAK